MGAWRWVDADHGESTPRADLIHAEAARKVPNELGHALVLQTNQAKYDTIEARIRLLETPKTQ